MTRRLLTSAFVVLLALAPLQAVAWSALGHRLVAQLAQAQLSPAALAQVQLLLDDKTDSALANVATWADELRDDDDASAHDAALGKASQGWHYVNLPPDCSYAPARDCPDGNCVVGAIDAQRAILADPARSVAERRQALKFIVHFVGDVHQPMHVGNHRDRGGNDYQVSLRTTRAPDAFAARSAVNGVQGTNLHAIWDYYLLGTAGFGAGKDAVVPYARHLAPLPASMASPVAGDVVAWAEASCRLIDARHLYPATHRMDDRYLDANRPLAEQRVVLAAAHLAALLNATLSG